MNILVRQKQDWRQKKVWEESKTENHFASSDPHRGIYTVTGFYHTFWHIFLARYRGRGQLPWIWSDLSSPPLLPSSRWSLPLTLWSGARSSIRHIFDILRAFYLTYLALFCPACNILVRVWRLRSSRYHSDLKCDRIVGWKWSIFTDFCRFQSFKYI